MARHRKEKTPAGSIKLKQPDRSAPTEQTLLDMVDQRQLLQQVKQREKELAREKRRAGADDENEDDSEDEDDGEVPQLSPGAERFLEAALWTVSLATLHFTFDVLVQHQYGTAISWQAVWLRAGRAWLGMFRFQYTLRACASLIANCAGIAVFLFLFYFLHAQDPNTVLVPGIPVRYQATLRQAVFFIMSVISGCYLIYISNTYGYLATMKQAPPLGCLWLWAVVEMDLLWGASSLLVALIFLRVGGYDIK